MKTAAVIACVVGLGGCDWADNMITISHVEGSYHWAFAPDGDTAIDVARERTVFEAPEQVPECCMGIYRRDVDTLEIVVGNRVEPPATGACPPVGEMRLLVSGVTEAAPALLALSPENTRGVIWYDRPVEGTCRPTIQVHEPEDQLEVAVTGQLKLQSLHCLEEPDGSGWPCPLVAQGAWAIEGLDRDVQANGTFAINDDYVPLDLD